MLDHLDTIGVHRGVVPAEDMPQSGATETWSRFQFTLDDAVALIEPLADLSSGGTTRIDAES